MYTTSEYSNEEKVQTLIIAVIAVILSIIISLVVVGQINKKLENYEKAVRIVSEEQFIYAIDTQYSGGLFGSGNVHMTPVTDKRLSGSYGVIADKVERYTRHTRQVCKSTDSKGKCTEYKEEVYYTWDYSHTNTNISSTLIFMGKEFSTSVIGVKESQSLDLSSSINPSLSGNVSWNYLYDQNVYFNNVGDLRHSFYFVPVDFYGNMYIRSDFDGLKNEYGDLCGCQITVENPDNIIASEKKTKFFMQFVFPFLLPIIVTVIAVLYFYNNDQ